MQCKQVAMYLMGIRLFHFAVNFLITLFLLTYSELLASWWLCYSNGRSTLGHNLENYRWWTKTLCTRLDYEGYWGYEGSCNWCYTTLLLHCCIKYRTSSVCNSICKWVCAWFHAALKSQWFHAAVISQNSCSLQSFVCRWRLIYRTFSFLINLRYVATLAECTEKVLEFVNTKKAKTHYVKHQCSHHNAKLYKWELTQLDFVSADWFGDCNCWRSHLPDHTHTQSWELRSTRRS